MESYDLSPFVSSFLHFAVFSRFVVWSTYQYFTPLYWWILFRCLSKTHFIHSPVDEHLSISIFGYYEWCCYEHSCVIFMWTCVSSSLGYTSRTGIVELCGKWMLIFWGIAKLYSKATASFYIPATSLQPCQHLLLSFFFLVLVISVVLKWCLIVVLICISPLTNDLSISLCAFQ